jgi:DNA-binding response OmpR family regulator
MRILIADDDEDLRTTLRVVLERAGYEVDAVPDGEQAIKAQCRHPADILITDLFMPQRDGLETVAYFRQHHPRTRIVAISGGGFTGQRTNHLSVAQQAGADVILRKPFEMGLLLERLRALGSPG